MDTAELEADRTELSVLINKFTTRLIEFKNKASEERLKVINKIKGLSDNEEIGDQLKKNSTYKNLAKKLYNPENLKMPDSFKNIKQKLEETMDLFDPALPNIGFTPKEIKDMITDKELLDKLKKERAEEEKELNKLKAAKDKGFNRAANSAFRNFEKKMKKAEKERKKKEAALTAKINAAVKKK